MTSIQAIKYIMTEIMELYEIDEAVSIAAIVLEDAFGIKLEDVSNTQALSEEDQIQLNTIIDRLLTNEPVQYVVGKSIFYGFPFKVNPNVLIPRQETEELAAWVLEMEDLAADAEASPLILDIGTGSGCIAVTIKKKRPEWEVHALDVSRDALETARGNAALNNAEVHFHQVDILDENEWNALPVFDLIVSNPPYIRDDERKCLPKNVVDFEPHLALFSGSDDEQRFVKKIGDFARSHLRIGGYLFLETNEYYASDSLAILEKMGFGEVELRKDLNKKDRMLRVRKTGD